MRRMNHAIELLKGFVANHTADAKLGGMSLLSSLAAIAVWQEQLEFWAKMIATGCAVASAIATFLFIRAKHRRLLEEKKGEADRKRRDMDADDGP